MDKIGDLMKHLAKFSALALCLALAPMAVAQETTESTDEAFPTGTQPEVQIGQAYQAGNFDDWEMVCVKAESGPEQCEIGQLVMDDAANPIADVRIFPLPQGSQAIAGSTILTPLGVSLANGLLFAVDEDEPKQYPFAFCNNVGCISRVGFTPLELQKMRKGAVAKMTIRLFQDPNNPISIGLSLKGFSDAYAALTKKTLQ